MKNELRQVAIIPDRNRTWALKKGLQPWEGHRAGAEVLRPILRASIQEKIPYLGFWALSEGNAVRRSRAELNFLDLLFEEKFRELAHDAEIHDNGVRIRVIGAWAKLLQRSVQAIAEAQSRTRAYTNFNLTVFIGYSGVSDMLQAMQRMKEETPPRPGATTLDKEEARKYLWTAELPDIDLLIRTGSDPHNSEGFMMWHQENTEYSFRKDILWPDYTPAHFREDIQDFRNRRRMQGA